MTNIVGWFIQFSKLIAHRMQKKEEEEVHMGNRMRNI